MHNFISKVWYEPAIKISGTPGLDERRNFVDINQEQFPVFELSDRDDFWLQYKYDAIEKIRTTDVEQKRYYNAVS